MKRAVYNDDHDAYRAIVRQFFEREVVPHYDQWEEQCLIDRAAFRAAATQGVYGLGVPEEYGGSGVDDFRYRSIVCEESARVHATAFGVTMGLFDDIVLCYLAELTDDEQRKRWLPGIASGELIGAIAMTEPGAGSDLRGIRTTATPDGKDFVINGSKTFISCGTSCDLVVVAARTGEGRSDFGLFVVEGDMPGFVRGRQLRKVGLHAQDTAELFFDDVRVPSANLIGDARDGLRYLMRNLPRERLSVVVQAYASARAIYDVTRDYCFARTAFGKPIGDFQNTRFVLAEIETELDVAEAYVDRCVVSYNAGELTATDAAKGKWYLSELLTSLVNRCVQLHGGYGYMLEYPVARAFADSRVQTIYGGTTEIMKEIVGREIARGAS